MSANIIRVYISLGSNLGDRNNNLDTALTLISHIPGVKLMDVSDYLETEPWGFTPSHKFLNCAASIDYNPTETKKVVCNTEQRLSENVGEEESIYLLNALKNIEWVMGRRETLKFNSEGKRLYHSRIIDIDILFYGTENIRTERLTVPHPLMKERDFVMIPLRQIADSKIISSFPDIFGK